MLLRAEEDDDHASVYAVNSSAFDTPSEANLVNALREQARPLISIVAEDDGKILGHILFSPVSLSGNPRLELVGLAPMAVVPEHQRLGIGSALVRGGPQTVPTVPTTRIRRRRRPRPPGVLPALRFPAGLTLRDRLRIRRAGRYVHGDGIAVGRPQRNQRASEISSSVRRRMTLAARVDEPRTTRLGLRPRRRQTMPAHRQIDLHGAPDRGESLYVVAFDGGITGSERGTKRFVIPREEPIGKRIDVEPRESRRLVRRRLDTPSNATQIDASPVRTKASANPIAHMAHEFDVEAGLFPNLTLDGLLRRLARLDCAPRQFPAEEITPNRKQDLSRRAIPENHGLRDHERFSFAHMRGDESPPGDRRVLANSAPKTSGSTPLPDRRIGPAFSLGPLRWLRRLRLPRHR